MNTSISLKMSVLSEKDFGISRVRLVFYDESDAPVAEWDSYNHDLSYQIPTGTSNLNVEAERIRLKSGQYRIAFVATDPMNHGYFFSIEYGLNIVIKNDALSGAMILGAIGLYSPAAAAHTLAGSCVGVGTALACGAPAADIGAGLWGFNPAPTALAVSVFFVPNASSYALATGGACATSLIFGGVKGTMAGVAGVPARTLPFCAAAIGCHLLGQSGAMGLALAASPHSPERNTPA